jgi:pimeloyl-ACP methyl ester carboxylesterase
MVKRVVFALYCSLVVAGVGANEPSVSPSDSGRTEWVTIPAGRLKLRVYEPGHPAAHPVLIVVLHGDIPHPPPSYQYEFAQRITAQVPGVIAAGVLRPGYSDSYGDTSSGVLGDWVGDNYTTAVIDAVAEAVGQLRRESSARAVILVGHSGGAAIAGDLIGRHPGLAEGALLVSCPCDVPAWRAYMKGMRPAKQAAIWEGAVPSLSPVALAKDVAPRTRVRLVVGSADDVAPPRFSREYVDTLTRHGVDARLSIEPGLGHDILLEPAVMSELRSLITELAR